jgi:hypothetical protein
MTGTTISGSYMAGFTLTAAGNPAYVAASGVINTTSGSALYGPSGTNFTLINAGSLSAVNGAGLKLAAGGSATNTGHGTINGLYGIDFGREDIPGTAYNAGQISASSVGVVSYYALALSNVASGTISGYFGVYTGGPFGGGGAGTVTNAGQISGTATGVYLKAGGTITNEISGLITATGSAYSEVGVKGAVHLVNDGTIEATRNVSVPGTQQYHSAVGVDSQGGGVFITNGLTGVILGESTNVYTRAYGIYSAAIGTVVNQGTIEGVSAGTSTGIKLQSGGTVTNEAGGLIAADGFGNRAILIKGAGQVISQVVNAGTISGGSYAAAVDLQSLGSVTNQAGGVISGNYGILTQYSSTIADIITNAGMIATSGNGVEVSQQPGVVTNQTGGVINAGRTGVIMVGGGGTLVNQAGAQITGVYAGVAFYSGASTIINAGTITGTATSSPSGRYGSVVLGAGYADRVVVDPGAVFQGLVDGGNVVDASAVSSLELAAGSGTITGFGTQFINFGSIDFDAGADWFVQGSTSGLGGTIAGFAQGDTIELGGITVTGSSYADGVLTLTDIGGTATLDLPGDFTTGAFSVANVGDGADVSLQPICYLPGTRIATPSGDVAVEQLRVGELVMTARGEHRPIVWIGTGQVLATRGRRSAATPVIVRKGALGANVPHSDLRVTKAHSLYIDGVLVPVEFLVNHRTILWDDHAQEVTVYHIELETHDVLLANGAPAESYRDDGNRWLFQNANRFWHLPAAAPCAPVLTGGSMVDAIWRRLLDRAGPRPKRLLTDDPDLHLLIDGRRFDPEACADDVHLFRLPAVPASMRVISRAGCPAELGLARDPRVLGVALRRIVVRQGTRFRIIEAQDDRLTDGFHLSEPDRAVRWTSGDAGLPAALFGGFDGPLEVVVQLAGATSYLADDEARRVA